MNELTRPQQRILDFIQGELRADRPAPTHQEIAGRFGFRSTRAAACHLEALRRKGFIESERGKARSLRVVSPLQSFRKRIADIPIVGSIPAGFADRREQEAKGCVSIDIGTLGIKPSPRTFALEVRGDSPHSGSFSGPVRQRASCRACAHR
jgi:repressor LexA